MTSRLTTLAVTFAVLASASIAPAANVSSHAPAALGAKPVRIIELPRVVVTAKRIGA